MKKNTIGTEKREQGLSILSLSRIIEYVIVALPNTFRTSTITSLNSHDFIAL